MPIKNDPSAVRSQIQQALRDKVLSQTEASRLLTSIKSDGVTKEEVDTVVKTLQEAIASGQMDTSTTTRKNNINRFLGQLDQQHALPLAGRPSGPAPSGSVNWLNLLTQQNAATPEVLPERSFSRQPISTDNQGQILLGDHRLRTDATPPSAELNDALWGLTKPGQTQSLPAEHRTALQKTLTQVLDTNLAGGIEAPDKFKRFTAATAAAAALGDTAATWDAATIDSVLKAAASTPAPMMQALLLRGLDNAALSPEQKTARTAIATPKDSTELLAAFDQFRMEESRLDFQTVKGEAVPIGLSALTFAKSKDALENINNGMKAWRDLDNPSSRSFEPEEVQRMGEILQKYVDGYPQASFVFGTFATNAPKEIANVTNARVTASLTPGLDANPPKLQNFPLSRQQADYVKTLLPNLKDQASVEHLVKSLAHAEALFSPSLPSSWGTPTTPRQPMSEASFALFKDAAATYQERAAGTPTGKLEYKDFFDSFQGQVKDIHTALQPRLRDLAAQPPRWGQTTLSPEAASFVKETLQTNLRSTMSVDNIGRAIDIYGKANAGKLEGAGLESFKSLLTNYKAQWPDKTTFDFNKLERIASFKVQGKEVPLCSLNGQQVSLADFYDKVGLQVSKSVDRSMIRHEWMADRFGNRARQAVEVLDVVAEKTARGEGPVALLRQQFPGANVSVQATARDGAHEQFVFVVEQQGRKRSFTQGSDGTVKPYDRPTDPVLFNATIGKDGELNLQTPDKLSSRKYALQTNYGVGDKIDVVWRDPSGKSVQTEGQLFETPNRVLQGEITAFDASGNYTVKYKTPTGEDVTKTVALDEIRRANNPHFFKPQAAYFSDVTINLQTDEALKKFLQDAQPIIDRHLPADGSLAKMSPAEITKRQKACIKDLMAYTEGIVKYPADKDTPGIDENTRRYHELEGGSGLFPLGDLVKIGKGVCRHQCILEHLLLQQAGIDSRLASGAANTSGGNFRGYHIWAEVNLADDTRFLSDQTWSDETIPLWQGAYDVDKRRAEMTDRTARYDYALALDSW